MITEELAKRAEAEDKVYIFLGDMNTDDRDHAAYKAIENNKFSVPDFPASNSTGKKYFDPVSYTHLTLPTILLV